MSNNALFSFDPLNSDNYDNQVQGSHWSTTSPTTTIPDYLIQNNSNQHIMQTEDSEPWMADLEAAALHGDGTTPYLYASNFDRAENLREPHDDNVDTFTLFDSVHDANSWRNEQSMYQVEDDTLPTSDEERRAFVKVLFKAFKSIAKSKDNPHMQQPFINQEHDNARVEVVCWLILEMTEARSRNGPLLMAYKPKQAKEDAHQLNFEQRFNEIVVSLSQEKTICKHLMDAPYIMTFIDDPIHSRRRTQSNRDLNKKKGEIMAAGKKATGQDKPRTTPRRAKKLLTRIRRQQRDDAHDEAMEEDYDDEMSPSAVYFGTPTDSPRRNIGPSTPLNTTSSSSLKINTSPSTPSNTIQSKSLQFSIDPSTPSSTTLSNSTRLDSTTPGNFTVNTKNTPNEGATSPIKPRVIRTGLVGSSVIAPLLTSPFPNSSHHISSRPANVLAGMRSGRSGGRLIPSYVDLYGLKTEERRAGEALLRAANYPISKTPSHASISASVLDGDGGVGPSIQLPATPYYGYQQISPSPRLQSKGYDNLQESSEPQVYAPRGHEYQQASSSISMIDTSDSAFRPTAPSPVADQNFQTSFLHPSLEQAISLNHQQLTANSSVKSYLGTNTSRSSSGLESPDADFLSWSGT